MTHIANPPRNTYSLDKSVRKSYRISEATDRGLRDLMETLGFRHGETSYKSGDFLEAVSQARIIDIDPESGAVILKLSIPDFICEKMTKKDDKDHTEAL